MKKYLFLTYFIFLLNSILAQDTSRVYPNFLVLQNNFQVFDNQNIKISPAIYFGAAWGLDLNYLRDAQKFRQEISICNSAGLGLNIDSKLSSNQEIAYQGALNYSILAKTNYFFGQNEILLGGSWDIQGYSFINQTLGNSGINYDVFTSLAFNAMHVKSLKFYKWKFLWSEEFRISLLSAYLKDAYNYPAPEGYISVSGSVIKKIYKSFQLKSPWKLTRWLVKEEITRNLHNGNRISLSYQWQYYKLRQTFYRWSAFHTLGLAFYFNL